MAQQMADLTKLKALATSQLKQGSKVRDLILSEPNELPREIARVKLDIYIPLIYAEIDSSNVN